MQYFLEHQIPEEIDPRVGAVMHKSALEIAVELDAQKERRGLVLKPNATKFLLSRARTAREEITP